MMGLASEIVACDSVPKGGKIGYVGTDASR